MRVSFGCAVRNVLHHLCARVYVTPPTPPRPCGDKGRFARSRAGFEKVAKWVTRAIVPPRRALVRLPRRRTQRIVGVNGRRVRACASSSRIPERDERIPELSSASYAKGEPPLSPPPRGRDRRVVVEAWRGVGARYWCGFRALQPFNALALLPRPCPHFTCAMIVEYMFVRSHSSPTPQVVGFKDEPGAKRARRPSLKLMSAQIDSTPHGNATVRPPGTAQLAAALALHRDVAQPHNDDFDKHSEGERVHRIASHASSSSHPLHPPRQTARCQPPPTSQHRHMRSCRSASQRHPRLATCVPNNGG